jgi:6-phosphogluconolactonase/glucosamine-6-phosphate isomerase/deaminase
MCSTGVLPKPRQWISSPRICLQKRLNLLFSITLTYPVLEASRDAAFLVAGKAKQEVVAPVRAGDVALPAALIRPVGRLHWFTDRNVAPVGAT